MVSCHRGRSARRPSAAGERKPGMKWRLGGIHRFQRWTSMGRRRLSAQIGSGKITHGVPLDSSKPPITFVQQALDRLPAHVPFFGRPVGFIVNYSPDQGVRCDLSGTPVEVLSKAYRVGAVLLSLAGRPVEARVLGAIMGA